jgi:pyruvate-ferredoxin/flavodoxin oxidoreductase
MEKFIQALPKTVKRISVLDRSKDPAAHGEPLLMDVATTLQQTGHPAQCFGGRYGLASREFTPAHAKAVFDNMRSDKPKVRFTVGITDDVTFLSLPPAKMPSTGKQMKQCIFWGLGGDGTVGANKAAIKAAIDQKQAYAQGYFAYSADKSNSLTRSFLRFSTEPIIAHYAIGEADFIGCTLPAYVTQYKMADALKEGGTFLLNFPTADIGSLERALPADLKKALAKKKARLFIVNATDIALKCGLRNKISTVIQASFYQLSQVLGDGWLPITEKWIEQEYGRLGDDIVRCNKLAAGMTPSALQEVAIPESWKDAQDPPGSFKPKSEISFLKEETHPIPEYKTAILEPAFRMSSAALPVSAFRDSLGGVSPLGATRWLKKGLSLAAPRWNPKACVQCNVCAAVCPQSVIRPFLVTDGELKAMPAELQAHVQTLPARGRDVSEFRFLIQASPYDCVNCEMCISICPTKSLSMANVSGSDEANEFTKTSNDLYIYLNDKIPQRGSVVSDKFSVRGSQFQQPLIEFPGSCQGCNETMVTKLVTQLFGKRLMIANASGCSSVWGGSFTKVPFITDARGRGPAWARSLFEDNAEFGFGMAVGLDLRRSHLHDDVGTILKDSSLLATLPKGLTKLLAEWYEKWQDGDATLVLEEGLAKELQNVKQVERLGVLQGKEDLWVKTSHWILGGDGWAYDIGFGGLDHVLASGKNFNVLVFDNEIYANTGGQQSKATQIGAVAQFAALGKDTAKKDLGFMMMNYGNVYVASVALGSQKDIAYVLKCLKEAESFNGPSIVLCYCNCIMHNIKGALGAGGSAGFKAHQLAVEGGYWPVYSFDPRREAAGKNPFDFVSKPPNDAKLDEFLNMEVRFNSLRRINPKLAAELRESLHKSIKRRYRIYENFKKAFEPGAK